MNPPIPRFDRLVQTALWLWLAAVRPVRPSIITRARAQLGWWLVS